MSEILGVIASSDIEAGTPLFQEIAMLEARSDHSLPFQRANPYNVCEFVVILINRNTIRLYHLESAPQHTATTFADVSFGVLS